MGTKLGEGKSNRFQQYKAIRQEDAAAAAIVPPAFMLKEKKRFGFLDVGFVVLLLAGTSC